MHVQITNFGGIFPALKPRALPGDGAQINRNLLASVPDFRPLPTDLNVAVSGTNNPLTLHRHDRKADGTFNTDMTTGWVVNAAQVSYVKGPINNDTTERTFYTFDDGSAPPRWLDLTGVDRQLGVPKPSAAPTVVVNEATQFTGEDRTSAIEAAIQQIVTATRTRAAATWVGGSAPGTGTAATGYLNLQTGYGNPATQAQQARLFGYDSYNGARNGLMTQFYGAAGSNFEWLWHGGLQPFWLPADGSLPGWANVGAPGGSYRDNIGISFVAYGLGYTLNSASLTTDIAAIPMPGKTDGTKLLTAPQVAELVTRIGDRLAYTGTTEGANKVAALSQAVDELRTMMNGGVTASIQATFTGYFAGAAITTFIDTELDTWANRVFDIAAQCVVSGIPVTDYGANGA
jgi:hypothetical protein